MRASLIQVLATATVLVAATPVLADSDVRTARVSHADLNIASATGRAVLDRRVNGAIKRVCNMSGQRNLVFTMQERRCVKEARARARTDIAALEHRAGVEVAVR